MFEIDLAPDQVQFHEWRPGHGRVFAGLFALRLAAAGGVAGRPERTPSHVLAAASDGRRGALIAAADLGRFFDDHAETGFIGHGLAPDLRALQRTLSGSRDLYSLVEQGKMWDTEVLARLLSLATDGDPFPEGCPLQACARLHLGRGAAGEAADVLVGDTGRLGRFLGRPTSAIPVADLRPVGAAALTIWRLFWSLNASITAVLRAATGVWGYIDAEWLKSSIRDHGPLTHHVQLRSSILMDAIGARGIAVDASRRDETRRRANVVAEAARTRLQARGYLIDQPGSDKALQSILGELARQDTGFSLRRTASGGFSVAAEDLAALAVHDEFFQDYATYRAATSLALSVLDKMCAGRIHARFGYLVGTGRTSCREMNLQNLPKSGRGAEAGAIRSAFVPGEGRVFIDADYAQIELATFAYACTRQFGLDSGIARLLRAGEDVHRMIAAAVMGKPASEVTKAERDGAKPVSFGHPVGMGATTIRLNARASYGVDLTLEEVESRIEAYRRLCPELADYLRDEVDVGLAVASELGLTPRAYREALGEPPPDDANSSRPAGWLGWMLLKVLRDQTPETAGGRPYSERELRYFWDAAERLSVDLRPDLRARLIARQATPALRYAVKEWFGLRPVFTATGRLRAGASFCAARNCVFQGLAADGAIYGLWLVWRAGHAIVNFVHDQIVVESPADERTRDRAAEVAELMRRGMEYVVPAMPVRVETVITRSLDRRDLDPRYLD